MRFLKDFLFYSDLAGKRRPRRYAAAALVIVLVIAAIAVFSQVQRSQARAEMFTPARPVAAQAAAEDAGPEAAQQLTPTAEPASDACPEDPAAWRLQSVSLGGNLQSLAPDCVYQGLVRTVAWHMLERLGYSKPEAADMLGFPEIPYHSTERVTALTSLKGPLELAVSIEWGPHPDYRYWTLGPKGEPGLAYALSGCYRAQTVVGGRVEAWGPHPVHCLVAVDYDPGWTLHALGEHRYAAGWADLPGARTFVLFGYAGEGEWVLIGELTDLYVAHDQLGGDPAGDRQATAARHGLPVWDAGWLFETFSFEPYPLPDGWQLATDPAALEPMQTELELYMEAPK